MKTLRPDQTNAIDDVRAAMHETRRVVLQCPCGWGKTVLTADIVRSAREKGKRALITVPALSLVDQTVEALYAHGISGIGVIQASHELTSAAMPVQVASIQTLMRRPDLPEHDVAIVDEVHWWFSIFTRWLPSEQWRKTPVLGLSATPWTKGLGAYFDRLIVGATIDEMIAAGTLVPFRVYAASHPDLEGVRSLRDMTGDLDYAESDLAERMNRPKLVADVVESWKRLGENRPTICFAVNCDHAAHLTEQFTAAGVPAAYMDANTKVKDWTDLEGVRHEGRETIRLKFLAGAYRVVCHVDVIGTGVDWPEVSCTILARPTRSEIKYVQNVGRGLRTSPGKTSCIVIDHSDTTLRLGFVSDIHYEALDDGQPRINGAKPIELPKECPSCHYLKAPRTAVCPQCGHEVVHHAKPVIVAAGTLKEIKADDLGPHKPMPAAKQFPSKHKVYGELMWYQRKHGKKDKWADAHYKTLFGVWPREASMGDWRRYFGPPSMELASWIRSRQIAWVKRNNGNRWGVNGNGPVNGHALDQGVLGERAQAVLDRAGAAYEQAQAREHLDGLSLEQLDAIHGGGRWR